MQIDGTILQVFTLLFLYESHMLVYIRKIKNSINKIINTF